MSVLKTYTITDLLEDVKNPLRVINDDYQRTKFAIASKLMILGVTKDDLERLCSEFYEFFLEEANCFIAQYFDFRKTGSVPQWAVDWAKENGLTPQEVYRGGFTFWEAVDFPFTPEIENAFCFSAYQAKLHEYGGFSEYEDNNFQKLDFLTKYVEKKDLPDWAIKVLCVYLYGFVGFECNHDYTVLKTYYQNAVEGINYPGYFVIEDGFFRRPIKSELKAWKPKFVIRKKRMEEDIEKMTIVREAKNQQCKNRTDLYLCVMDLAEKKTGKEISYQTAMNWAKAYEKQGYKLFES